jgi:uncharacterized protein (DUF3820 family)
MSISLETRKTQQRINEYANLQQYGTKYVKHTLGGFGIDKPFGFENLTIEEGIQNYCMRFGKYKGENLANLFLKHNKETDSYFQFISKIRNEPFGNGKLTTMQTFPLMYKILNHLVRNKIEKI